MKAVRLVLGVSMLFWMGSCDRPELDPTPVDLEVTMYEVLGEDASTLQLFFQTEQQYGCSNYQILMTALDTINEVSVDVEGVMEPSACLGDFAPAFGSVYLTNRRSTRPISVVQGDIVSTGTLDIQADRYVLEIDQPDGLVALNSELMKVPNDLYWGIVSLAASTVTQEYQDFLETMSDRGALLSPELTPGEYSYFNVATNGDFSIPSIEENAVVKYIYFTYPLDAQTLQSSLDDFVNASFTVQLTSYQGANLDNIL